MYYFVNLLELNTLLMKAKFYISGYCLLFSAMIYAQNDATQERQDHQPPAITVADVEEDAQQATNSRKEYSVKKEELKAPVAKKEKEENEKQIAVTNTAEKASKKPEKQ
jgi:electron transfer flavoprotein alpha subunit